MSLSWRKDMTSNAAAPYQAYLTRVALGVRNVVAQETKSAMWCLRMRLTSGRQESSFTAWRSALLPLSLSLSLSFSLSFSLSSSSVPLSLSLFLLSHLLSLVLSCSLSSHSDHRSLCQHIVHHVSWSRSTRIVVSHRTPQD